ncbi:MAG: UDP-N-acetylmuramoyl-L-alanine--D-glutamate ligase [Actinomycetota bacterium]
MRRLAGTQALVLGLGKSGMAVARALTDRGAVVHITDSADNPEVKERARMLSGEGVDVVPWTAAEAAADAAQLVVVSPGVPVDSPPILAGKSSGASVISELELAYSLTDSPITAVTGTNGKGTVVTWLGEMYKAAGRCHIVAGNIGRPLIDAIGEATPATTLIVEVSSFQLETVIDFRPRVGVLLNITEDHIDRHGDMETYRETKARLFANQTNNDFAVVNADDAETAEIINHIPCNLIRFSAKSRLTKGVWLEEDRIVAALPPDFTRQDIGQTAEIKVVGQHNLENALAASAAALLDGIPVDAVQRALVSFGGLPHRISYVTTIKGITFYDDSKATNPDAAKRAIEAFDGKIVLLAGGRNKGLDFSELAGAAARRARAVVVFGEAAEDIAAAVKKVSAEDVPVNRAATLDDAVRIAYEAAKPGDTVLLSPGCASFDMFRDYAERGRAFRDAANRLAVRESGKV